MLSRFGERSSDVTTVWLSVRRIGHHYHMNTAGLYRLDPCFLKLLNVRAEFRGSADSPTLVPAIPEPLPQLSALCAQVPLY